MKFSGKMCLMIILKVTKNQSFTLCLEDTFFEKPQGGRVNEFYQQESLHELKTFTNEFI